MNQSRLLIILSSLLLIALIISGISPAERLTWFLEILPILIAVPVLALTYKKFPLTNLLYVLIFLHALVLVVGGYYTYGKVPLGFWMQDVFGLARNPYDRIGHFAQGFIPVLIVREFLLRKNAVNGRGMLAFLAVSVTLAISALWELFEWWMALLLGQGADEFLGLQGDIWDTQSDMFMCLIGSLISLAILSRLYDRQLKKFQPDAKGELLKNMLTP